MFVNVKKGRCCLRSSRGFVLEFFGGNVLRSVAGKNKNGGDVRSNEFIDGA